MGMLGQMGDMYKLQKEAKRLKKELAQMHIVAEEDGIKITVSGEQEVIGVEISDDSLMQDKVRLEKAIKNASNRSFKKAQQVAAEKMQGIMGGLGGLMGQ